MAKRGRPKKTTTSGSYAAKIRGLWGKETPMSKVKSGTKSVRAAAKKEFGITQKEI